MKKGFSAYNPQCHKGKTNTWFTPIELVKELGIFDLDPCTESTRPYDLAESSYNFDLGQDGLKMNWFGRVWLNPPYGKNICTWLDKLYEHQNGIALVFARTETKWAQKHLEVCDAVNFLKGRIKFYNPDIKSTNAANGNMLLAYGEDNVDYIKNIQGITFYNEQK